MRTSRAKKRHEFKVGDTATVKEYDFNTLQCLRVVKVVRTGKRVTTDDGAAWFVRSYSEEWKRFGKRSSGEYLHAYTPGDQINVARYVHAKAREKLEDLLEEAKSTLRQCEADLEVARKRAGEARAAMERAKLRLREHNALMPMKDPPELTPEAS